MSGLQQCVTFNGRNYERINYQYPYWNLETILKKFQVSHSDNLYSLRASDRFVQLIFHRIFRCIEKFIRGNGCDICWSAVTCMGDSWRQSPQVSRGVTPFLICPNLVQKKVPNKRTLLYPELTKNPIAKRGQTTIFIPIFTLILPCKIYG